MTTQGRFIVLEGLEGAGKSTALSLIQGILTKHVSEVIVTREPGGTFLGESIRTLLKQSEVEIDSRSELLLFYAARVQLIEEVIKPALARGAWVIGDRFECSTFAYQGGGRGVPLSFLKELSAYLLNGFKPDLTLLLDVSPSIGLERVALRGPLDRIEEESLPFFEKVYAAYHQQRSNDSTIHCIDATQPLDVVHRQISAVIQQFLYQYVS